MHPSTWALVALVVAAGASCAGDDPGALASEEDLEWGIGGRADGFGCDPASELCWTGTEAEAMRAYQSAQESILLGQADPWAPALAMVETLEALSHKMSEDELEATAALRRQAEGLPVDAGDEERMALVTAGHDAGGARLLSGYLTAYAVPLGQSTWSDDGAADSWGEEGDELPEVGLTEGMRESLDMLRGSGPLGQTYAFMLEHTGVLEDAPVASNGEFPFDEPREDPVDRVVRRACWATAGWSAVAGAESLIPYAGIVISISHEALMHFRLRARMVFQIAAIYGLDIRDDLNLLLAATALMTSYHLPDIQALWASSMALPVLAAAVERLGTAATVRAAIRTLLLRALASVLESVSVKGAEIVSRLAARAAVRGTGRSILGYATFGLALIGDVALATASTAAIGDHAHYLVRPWGSAMLLEGATTMVDPEARQCEALLLGRAAWADGVVDDDELRLLSAHLGRDAYIDGRYVTMNDESEITDQARQAAWPGEDAAGAAREAERCVEQHFEGIDDGERLALLSWFLTMAAVDGDLAPREQPRYEELVHQLDGSDWFGDGNELEEPHLEAMQQRVLSLLLLDERQELFADLGPEVLIERLDLLAPRAEATVLEAFGR